MIRAARCLQRHGRSSRNGDDPAVCEILVALTIRSPVPGMKSGAFDRRPHLQGSMWNFSQLLRPHFLVDTLRSSADSEAGSERTFHHHGTVRHDLSAFRRTRYGGGREPHPEPFDRAYRAHFIARLDNERKMTVEASIAALWAKTDRVNQTDGWLDLQQHLVDSAQTAAHLWDEFLPQAVKGFLTRIVGDPVSARCLVQFLAGIHDIGKATPAFEIQGTEDLVNHCRDAGLHIPIRLHERATLPHALAGQLITERWLSGQHGWRLLDARSYASVVGGHHGVFSTASQLNELKHAHHLLGEGLWIATQDALLTRMAERIGAAAFLDSWSRIPLPKTAQILLSAIVIAADWIASSTDYFDYENSADQRASRAQAAWDDLGLPQPWHAHNHDLSADDLLRRRFGLADHVSARPVQKAVLDIARDIETPGLFIIEAPMGVGKTEAALMLTEVLAARLGLGGLFFALPSMATSDAIFSRVHRWLDGISEHPESVFLAHSKSHLNEKYRGIAYNSRFVSIEPDGSERSSQTAAVVHEWLSGRKKGILASFAVGTIDQILFAALKSKHVVLRHLGLAGKVVVIDEVHAADEYMSVYLDQTLKWLGAYGVPVILLSATLPGERRRTMVEAYDSGRGVYQPAPPTRVRPGQTAVPVPVTPYDDLESLRGYPLITATDTVRPVVREVEAGTRETSVDVTSLDDDNDVIAALLGERLAGGGCAVVIRNTVGRAQQTYDHLLAMFGEDVTLVHSRFIATDRMRRETLLRERFGPPGPGVERPTRHVVVATQVVEQSLDIDFDLMITDIAPIDLILQRSGRLHRHDRASRPESVKHANLYITGVDWTTKLPEADKGSIAIYGEDALLRSLAVLGLPHSRSVSIPHDVPHLVQAAYGDDCPEPDGWETVMSAAREKAQQTRMDRKRRATNWLLSPPNDGHDVTGLTRGGIDDIKSDAKGQASVRDSQESLEVIVVQRRDDGLLYRWGAPTGEAELPIDHEIDRKIAHQVSACTLRLAPPLITPWQIDRTITTLERNLFPSWQTSPWLREQLVLVLDQNCQSSLPGFDISYSDEMGLVVTPQKEPNDA